MKTTALFIVIGLALFPALDTVEAGEGTVKSLRGEVPITAESPAPPETAVVTGRSRIPRTFPDQPPLVPHSIAEYEINLKENDCLNCHGAEGSGAPPPSASHYLDREGNKSEKVSMARHFCEQCHVPQENAPPLVTNTFGGAN